MDDQLRILEVKDLYTEFNTQDGVVHAVNGVSFLLKKGETLGIVGESGSGKSVSVLSVMRLLPEPPSKIASGNVYFIGEDMLKFSEKKMRELRGSKIAMIFQDPMTSLNPVLKIGTQLMEPARLHMGMDKKAATDRVVELLQMVGIPEPRSRLNDYPHQFSGGMRQRVMIAMGLICNPVLLIADEPTTALDVTIQAQIIELVKDLRNKLGMSLIWITHDLGIVAGLADRVIVMYAGSIMEEANVDDLYDNPTHPYTTSLMRSLPSLERPISGKLETIEGFPPDLINMPSGCPFADRCSYVQGICREQKPSLKEVGANHKSACWVNVQTGKLL